MSQENHTDSTDALLVEPAEIPQVLPAEPEAPADEKMPDTCPRCQGPLADPEGLGWCLGCGYCRATAEDGPKAPLTAPAPRKPSTLGAVEFLVVLRMVPGWLWLLLVGIAGAVHAALFAVQNTGEDTRARAIWCTAQIVAGVVLLVSAQLWALIKVAAIDDRLGARDAIIPFRLWNVSLKHLPKTSGPICLGTWALTLIVTAFFVVGGLSYWLPKKPDKKKAAIATEMRLAERS